MQLAYLVLLYPNRAFHNLNLSFSYGDPTYGEPLPVSTASPQTLQAVPSVKNAPDMALGSRLHMLTQLRKVSTEVYGRTRLLT